MDRVAIDFRQLAIPHSGAGSLERTLDYGSRCEYSHEQKNSVQTNCITGLVVKSVVHGLASWQSREGESALGVE